MNAEDIQILRVNYLAGPNIWTYRPVIEAWVDIGKFESFPSNTLPGFNERLTTMLPGLIEHHCSVGKRGGFLERLRDGTWIPHILEHVVLELQSMAGMHASFGKARMTAKAGLYKLAFRTLQEDVGRAALALSHEVVTAAIGGRACDIDAGVCRLREMYGQLGTPKNAAQLADEAASRRIPSRYEPSSSELQLGYGVHQRRIPITRPDATTREPVAGVLQPGEQANADSVTGPVGLGEFFPDGQQGRIPIIGIMGTENTAHIARLVAWLISLSGKRVAAACRDGLFIDGRLTEHQDSTSWGVGRRLLADRSVEAVVCEHPCARILTEGLPYDRCAVGVVTEVRDRERLQDFHVDTPEALFAVMRTQVDVVLPDGTAVLNAHDAHAVEMAGLCDGDVIFYGESDQLEAIIRQRAKGGRSVYLYGLCILFTQGPDEIGRISLADVQSNAAQKTLLAAAATAWALDLPPELIRRGLCTFDLPSEQDSIVCV